MINPRTRLAAVRSQPFGEAVQGLGGGVQDGAGDAADQARRTLESPAGRRSASAQWCSNS